MWYNKYMLNTVSPFPAGKQIVCGEKEGNGGMHTLVIFWAAATVVFLVVELATYGLASIWFALGGLAALVAAALHAPLWGQIALFAMISAAALAATRPLARKYVNARAQPTNADRVLGTEAAVREDIDNLAETGTVSADGKIWSARSADGAPLPAGTRVIVREIRGVRLIVAPAAGEAEEKAKKTDR